MSTFSSLFTAWCILVCMLWALCKPVSAATSPEELLRLLNDQDVMITQLLERVSLLEAERDALATKVAELNTTSSSTAHAEAASHARLRQETLRLAHRVSRSHPGSIGSDLDADGAWARAQQVSITCGDPKVTLTPLDREDAEAGICLVLSVAGNNLNSRFVLHCDEEVDNR